MNNEQKFWIYFLGICGVVVIVITICITAYWTDHNRKIVQLIKNGVPPVEAMCALQDDYGKNPTCIVIATKK